LKGRSSRKARSAASLRGDFLAVVAHNDRLSQCNYSLGLRLPAEATAAFGRFQPGEFVEIDLSHAPLPQPEEIPGDLADAAGRQILLRRPFSFADLVSEGEGLLAEVIYCVVGPATLRMRSLAVGDQVRVLGPLGHGFEIPRPGHWALLIAGGMGAPPIQHLARTLVRDHPDIHCVGFAGARSLADLPFSMGPSKAGSEWSSALGLEWQVATDDGSYGHRGFVTECLERWLKAETRLKPQDLVIYACGPEPMLAQVARIAELHGVDCQVSMERRMACGFGVCQGCAVECRAPEGQTVYRLCCQDGPVMDARQVVFKG
jgi:dihydroorotate dehydrogenase electron transfer subunit